MKGSEKPKSNTFLIELAAADEMTNIIGSNVNFKVIIIFNMPLREIDNVIRESQL
jgi:hypothetical protein